MPSIPVCPWLPPSLPPPAPRMGRFITTVSRAIVESVGLGVVAGDSGRLIGLRVLDADLHHLAKPARFAGLHEPGLRSEDQVARLKLAKARPTAQAQDGISNQDAVVPAGDELAAVLQ